MKKSYISPSILVVALNHQTHILAGSPGIATSNGVASGSGEVLGRESSFSTWGDEE
jgi:hypothetical protein